MEVFAKRPFKIVLNVRSLRDENLCFCLEKEKMVNHFIAFKPDLQIVLWGLNA